MKKLFLLVTSISAVAAGVWVAKALFKPEIVETDATVFQIPRPIIEFDLLDHHGEPFVRSNLDDQWTLAFFGFTHCPDICPTTLFLLSQSKKLLSDLPSQQQPVIAMFTVDPARDTPEQLADYVPHFGGDITGVTGPLPAIQSLTESLGVAYAYTPDGNGGYTVDHTASIFLISPDAQLKAVFTTPHESDTIARDLRHIISSYQ